MSDPISFPVDGRSSLQDLSGLLDIEREEIDFSQLTADQIFNFVAPPPTVVTNSSISEGNFATMADSAEDAFNVTGGSMNEDGLDGEDGGDGSDADDPPPKKKRSRFSFAKRKLVGGSALFSLDGFPVDGISGSLVGIILQCPRQANDHRFHIDWTVHSTGLPSSIDRTKLRSWYPSTVEMRSEIQHSCESYEEARDSGDLSGIIVKEYLDNNYCTILVEETFFETRMVSSRGGAGKESFISPVMQTGSSFLFPLPRYP
jgi:hypothetical protein